MRAWPVARAVLAALVLAALVVAVPAAGAAAQALAREEVLWSSVSGTEYVELYEFFLEQFPTSRHARDARIMIAILKGEIEPAVPKEMTAAERAAAEAARSPARAPALDPLNLDIARFQQGLREHGCNAGLADGIWGERTAGAAQRFVDAQGLDIDPSRPSVALFGAVMAAQGDVCGEL